MKLLCNSGIRRPDSYPRSGVPYASVVASARLRISRSQGPHARRQAPGTRPACPSDGDRDRTMGRLPAAYLAVVLSISACGSSPSAPNPPVTTTSSSTTTTTALPACVANNTATIAFSNRSRETVHDVLLDGVVVVRVLAGQTSAPVETAAGVTHRVQFRDPDRRGGCSEGVTPVLPQCSALVASCDF